MNTQSPSCQSTLELTIVFVMILSFLIIIISGIMLFGNEKLPKNKKGWLFFELIGPLHPLITKRYLNQRALKWRLPFLFSLLIFILGAIVITSFNLC